MEIKKKFLNFLKWSEKYTKTDMRYVARGSFWWIFGKSIAFLITLGVMSAFARFLPKETYGAWRYLLSMTAILSIFSLPGMDTALIRSIAKGYEKMLLFCAKVKLKWGLIGTIISFAISFWYLSHQNIALGISFFIAGIFLPLLNAFQIFLPFWQGKQRFDIQSKYLILTTFFPSLILVLTLLLTNNLIFIAFSFFFSYSIFKYLFFKLTTKSIKDQKGEEKETIAFGKHLTLIQSTALFSNQIDKIIIWQILGPASLAIYSFAWFPIIRIQELIPIIPLALPKLSKKSKEEIKRSVFEKFLKLFFVSLSFSFLFILLVPYFYKIFFPNYLESVIYARILALIFVLLPFSLFGASFLAQARKKELYIIQISTPILKILLFFALIPFFKIWGAVFSILAAQIYSSILSFYFFKKL
jgi:O-antigen/teichoic acid export membrane protein